MAESGGRTGLLAAHFCLGQKNARASRLAVVGRGFPRALTPGGNRERGDSVTCNSGRGRNRRTFDSSVHFDRSLDQRRAPMSS